MPATSQSMVAAAEKEWEFWGRSTWNLRTGKKSIGHTDDEDDFARHVLVHYCSVGGGSPSIAEIQGDVYFWSAVGISAIMQRAGFTKQEFPFAQSHSVFIRRFTKARRDTDIQAAFWGFRQGEAGGQPEVGDLVGDARGTGMTAKKAAGFFDTTTGYSSHSDVVVAKRDKEIDVIGANVLDSVTRKTLELDAHGHIKDKVHHWFVVLKRR